MQRLTLFLFALILFGCSNDSEREAKQRYVQAFVASCSEYTGNNELMNGICLCQANKIVEQLPLEDLKDAEKVKAFVLKSAAYECTQEAMQKLQPKVQ